MTDEVADIILLKHVADCFDRDVDALSDRTRSDACGMQRGNLALKYNILHVPHKVDGAILFEVIKSGRLKKCFPCLNLADKLGDRSKCLLHVNSDSDKFDFPWRVHRSTQVKRSKKTSLNVDHIKNVIEINVWVSLQEITDKFEELTTL
ncbi:hypothetical protein SUGI_0138440 [Cryptomeria japonica]|nr:hypothetical protein SUGI_0138440 [Cryptomeria japonica]